MNVLSLEFAGFFSGEVDFAAVHDRHPTGPGTVRDQLDEAVQRLATTVDADGALGHIAAMLAHDPPASETERQANRRVKFVFSFFGP